MRTIKFRGKQIHGGQWLYGYYFAYDCIRDNRTYHSIVPQQYSSKPSEHFHVIPETIGQFTGLHDKNGKEIYEGDIVKYIGNEFDDEFAREVRYDGAGFEPIFAIYLMSDIEETGCEVIGNIHDNPKLLTNN